MSKTAESINQMSWTLQGQTEDTVFCTLASDLSWYLFVSCVLTPALTTVPLHFNLCRPLFLTCTLVPCPWDNSLSTSTGEHLALVLFWLFFYVCVCWEWVRWEWGCGGHTKMANVTSRITSEICNVKCNSLKMVPVVILGSSP